MKGCPFICNVSDTSRVTLSLNHLELIPVDQPASFHMGVDGSGSAELAVSVRGQYEYHVINFPVQFYVMLGKRILFRTK